MKNSATWDQIYFIGSIFGAIVTASFIVLYMPHDREVKSLAILLFKLVPFVLANLAIAYLDLEFAKKMKMDQWCIPIAFLIIFCWFVPKIFFHADVHPKLYYTILMMTPFIILTLTMSFRLGGGERWKSFRLGMAMLLLMLSGLEDLAFLTVNNHTDPAWATIPEVWNWASHITVFIGHPPTRYEAYAFIMVHVILALFLLFWPTKKHTFTEGVEGK